jgi:MFS family permease
MAMTGAHWARFSVIGLGTLIGPLDSAVNIAFPDITGAFGIPLQSIQWVIICYVLTYGSLMLVFGRLGDQFGHLLIFQLGLGLSVAAFLMCGLAQQYEWLLAARIVQGIGTAMVISCGPALATGLFDESFRPRALGAYTMIFGIGGAIGPSLGGVLVDIWGWPSVFWFRLPIAAVTLLLTFLLRMPTRKGAGGAFDLLGAVLLAAGLGLLLLTINQASADMRTEFVIGLIVITILTFAALVLHERRTDAPVLRLAAFRDPDFTLVNLTGVAVNLAGFSVMLLVPYFLVRATDMPLTMSGAVLACGPVGMIAAAQIGGVLAQRIGANRLGFAGAAFVACGIGAIGFWPSGIAPAWMIAALLAQGIGLGFFQVANLDLVTAVLPRADRGVAGSLVMVTRTIGVVLAASLLTLVFVTAERAAIGSGVADSFLAGFQTTFRYTAGFLILFVGATCLRPGLWFAKWPRLTDTQ